jgi:hypothetical protein
MTPVCRSNLRFIAPGISTSVTNTPTTVLSSLAAVVTGSPLPGGREPVSAAIPRSSVGTVSQVLFAAGVAFAVAVGVGVSFVADGVSTASMT